MSSGFLRAGREQDGGSSSVQAGDGHGHVAVEQSGGELPGREEVLVSTADGRGELQAHLPTGTLGVPGRVSCWLFL